MKVFLLLNGPAGWQTGIEDGFSHLVASVRISDLKSFYFNDFAKRNGAGKTLEEAVRIAENCLPDIIIIFHIGAFALSEDFPTRLRNIASKPALVYDEGDMYGSWAKPMTKSMKILMNHSEVVSIRGLGRFADDVSKYCNQIIYTPHHADIARFDKEPHILAERAHKVVMIGNNVKPKLSGLIRRLPGSRKREQFADYLSNSLGRDFNLYGNGWGRSNCNRGPVDFQNQLEVYKNAWITAAFEHYPEVPYYFSNRLPLALLAGSIYVCHYHEGYENVFGSSDFMFYFRNFRESRDVINYLLSLSKEDLLERSRHAREFSLKHFHPNTHWTNFFDKLILKLGKK